MKILGLKGMHQISSVQSAERGSLVTYVNSVSPTGHFLPPLLVYPGKYMKPELMHGTPPGSIYACHSSGWIQSEIFTQWFLHFIKHTKPTKKILLSRYWTGTIHIQGTWRLYVFFWVFPRRLIVVCRRFGTLYLFHLHRLDVKYEVLHTSHPAYEDGTDRAFRNVGIQQSDAGEMPKRIHTRFKTRRKFEIKNLEVIALARENHVDTICLPTHNSHKM